MKNNMLAKPFPILFVLFFICNNAFCNDFNFREITPRNIEIFTDINKDGFDELVIAEDKWNSSPIYFEKANEIDLAIYSNKDRKNLIYKLLKKDMLGLGVETLRKVDISSSIDCIWLQYSFVDSLATPRSYLRKVELYQYKNKSLLLIWEKEWVYFSGGAGQPTQKQDIEIKLKDKNNDGIKEIYAKRDKFDEEIYTYNSGSEKFVRSSK